MKKIEPNPSSYRDYVARVIKKGSNYCRYISNAYKPEYDHLMNSGLYAELVKKDLLIEHQEVDLDTDDVDVYKLLLPAQIPFQSYPFEWSYTQWRKAALTYLKVNHIALKYGMILKDATPYNFYLWGGKARLFDTSSFIFFPKTGFWIAYRQFCEEFLSPIALMYYNGAQWSTLSMSAFRGLPLDFVSQQLPFKSWFNLTTFLHIHLHARYFSRKERDIKKLPGKAFSIEKVKSLMKMIYGTILRWEKAKGDLNVWDDYYEDNIESDTYLENKEVIIRQWLNKIRPESIVDLGSNTGRFSFIASEYAKKVVALEKVPSCVDAIEKGIVLSNYKNITTLVSDLSNTSPSFGLLSKEIKNVTVRGQFKLAFGLALIHHLFISCRIPFNLIVELFSSFTDRFLIVEFIPVTDEKVRLLASERHFDLFGYTQEAFLDAVNQRFNIIEERGIKESERKLYLLEKKSDEIAPKKR